MSDARKIDNTYIISKMSGEDADFSVKYGSEDIKDISKFHDNFLKDDLYMITSTDGWITWKGPIRVVGENGQDAKYVMITSSRGYALTDGTDAITSITLQANCFGFVAENTDFSWYKQQDDNTWLAVGIDTSFYRTEEPGVFKVVVISEGIDYEDIQSVIEVKNGESSFYIDLDNELTSIPMSSDGVTESDLTVSTGINIYYGTEKLVINKIRYDGNEYSPETEDVTVSITIPEGTTWKNDKHDYLIEVECEKGVKSINFSIQGLRGSSVICELSPQSNVVSKSKEGTLNPDVIICDIKENGEVKSISEVEGYSITYRLNTSDTEIPYPATGIPTNTMLPGTHFVITLYKTDGSILVDRETIPLVQDGVDGTSLTILDLSEEMLTVPLTSDGVTKEEISISGIATVYYGNEPLELTALTSSNRYCTCDYEDGIYIISIPSDTSFTNGKLSIPITATCDSGVFTKDVQILGARDGEGVMIYNLQPSVNSISQNKSGVKSPENISCGIQTKNGESVTDLTELPDGYALKYQLNGTGSDIGTTIGTDISVSSITSMITFKLYKGDTLIDKETVPLVIDGTDGTSPYNIHCGNENISISTTADYKPVSIVNYDCVFSAWRGTTALTAIASGIPGIDQYVLSVPSGLTGIGVSKVSGSPNTIRFTPTSTSTPVDANQNATVTVTFGDGSTATTTVTISANSKGNNGGYMNYIFAVGAFDLDATQLKALTWYDEPPATTDAAPCLYMASKWIDS